MAEKKHIDVYRIQVSREKCIQSVISEVLKRSVINQQNDDIFESQCHERIRKI